jgi:hypothetical protein
LEICNTIERPSKIHIYREQSTQSESSLWKQTKAIEENINKNQPSPNSLSVLFILPFISIHPQKYYYYNYIKKQKKVTCSKERKSS